MNAIGVAPLVPPIADLPPTVADRIANSRPHCCRGEQCQYRPYSETVGVDAEENETVQLFKSRNYKLSASLGMTSQTLHPLTVVLDTGAGPNLVDKRWLPSSWHDRIQPSPVANLSAAANQPIPVIGVILLHVRLGDLCTKVWFGVVERLVTPCLLGTSFSDRFIKAIFCMDRKVVPIHSRVVPILASGTATSPVCALNDTAKPDDPAPHVPPCPDSDDVLNDPDDDIWTSLAPPQDPGVPVTAAKRQWIPPMTQAKLLVRSHASGLVSVRSGGRLAERKRIAMAHGVVDSLPSRPFYVLVANFENFPVLVPKHATVGYARADVPAIHHLGRRSTSDSVSLLNAAGTAPFKEGGTTPNIEQLKNVSAKPSKEQEEMPPLSSFASLPDATPPPPSKEDWRSQLKLGKAMEPERARIIEMLSEFESMWDGHLGTIRQTKHRIELKPDSKPVHQPPYRNGPDGRERERQEIQKMLDMDVIEEAECEWASPILFVPKPDGTIRFCVDYRRLNAMTVRDSYPIPRMDECIDSLGDATIYTALDANCGYWQIEIDENDRDKTAFVSHQGLYRFKRMPFGLRNAPGTFQRAADVILAKVKWTTALVYLDDVIVYSRTKEEHYEHLRTVLSLLKDAGVSLKFPKCQFFQDTCDYLGHTITPGKLQVASKCQDAIRKAFPPRTVKELQSFLGLCNVYRRFVPNFARIAAPLTKKLRKGEPQNFGDLDKAESEAYERLRDSMISPPVLALPRAGYSYTLDTDACDYQVGCVLLQEQPDKTLRPVGYWSRSLTKAEKNYSTTEKECLAIVWAALMLRPYLEGVRFTLRTDHSALRWILNLADASGRLMRWRLRLSDFDYEVKHRAGVKHQAADTLSRLRTDGADTSLLDDAIPTLLVDDDAANEAQADVEDLRDEPVEWKVKNDNGDEFLLLQQEEVFGSERPAAPSILALQDDADAPTELTMDRLRSEQLKDSLCTFLRQQKHFEGSLYALDHNDVLVRRSPLDGRLQKVVPRCLVPLVLHLAHNPLHAGHPGGTRMYATIRESYYWRTMVTDIFEYVKTCRSCARIRGTRGNKQHKVRLFPAVDPLTFVAMDLVGPFPKTKSGYTSILVMTDRFTKVTRAVPMRSTKTAAVAEAFLQNWVYAYGIPKYILTDNGPQFTSKLFEYVSVVLGIDHLRTTAYHPETNGQSERYNRTLVTRLSHYVSEHQNDWDEYVQPLTYSYNNHVHRTTGFVPFSLALLYSPPSPLEAYVNESPELGAVPARPTDSKDGASTAKESRALRLRVRTMADRARGRIEDARRNLHRAQERYKEHADRRVRFTVNVRKGDYVFLNRPPSSALSAADVLADKPRSKLRPKTTGEPYRVIEATPNTVTIEVDGIPDTVSIDRVTVCPAPRVRSDESEPFVPPHRRGRQQTTQGPDTSPVEPETSAPSHESDEPSALASPQAASDSAADTERSRQAPPLPARSDDSDANDEGEAPSPQTPSAERPVTADPGPVSSAAGPSPLSDEVDTSSIAGPSGTRGSELGPANTPRSPPGNAPPGGPLAHSENVQAERSTENNNLTVAPDANSPSTKHNTVPAVLDRIMGHIVEDDGTIYYWCRWFGYDPKNARKDPDTEEPEEHLPAETVARYWRRFKANETASASSPSLPPRSSTPSPPRRSSRRRPRSSSGR